MPRGRKPIPRSQEEALQIRRDQIRRNVKAFRERKKLAEINTEQASPEVSTSSQGANDEPVLVALGADNRKCSNPGIPNPSLDLPLLAPKIVPESQCRIPLLLNVNPGKVCLQQFIANNACIFLPRCASTTQQHVQLGPHWAQNVPKLVGKSDLLNSSLQPLMLLQIACLKQERWLIEASRHYYSQALQALNAAISCSKGRFKHSIFTSTMILGVYELFNGARDPFQGWGQHLQGASSYLCTAPPYDEVFVEPSYFFFLEAVCVFDALHRRKPSPLALTKWWRQSTVLSAGDAYGSLLRILSTLPAYLEKFDSLVASVPDAKSNSSKAMLLEKGFFLEDRLRDWFATASKTTMGFHYSENMNYVKEMQDSIVAPLPLECITFPNLYVARLHLLYWSSMVALLDAQKTLADDLLSYASQTTPFAPSWSLDESVKMGRLACDANYFATCVRKSIDFAMLPSHGMVGRSIVLQTLRVVRNHFLPYDKKQAQWCAAILKETGQDSA